MDDTKIDELNWLISEYHEEVAILTHATNALSGQMHGALDAFDEAIYRPKNVHQIEPANG